MSYFTIDNERAFEAGRRGELPPDDLWPPPGEGLIPRCFLAWREGFRVFQAEYPTRRKRKSLEARLEAVARSLETAAASRVRAEGL